MRLVSFRSWGVCFSAVALIGCATSGGNAALQCGAGGAMAGYLLCKALGRPDAECLRAAAVIGAGGAAICYSYASSLERRRQELAGHENDLDHRIQYVRGLNEDSKSLNADLTKRVADVTKNTDTLVAQVRQKKITQEQLAKERQARDEEVKQANVQVAKGAEALKEVKTYRAQRSAPSAALDAEIAKQELLLASATQQVNLLSAQRARV